MCHAQDPASPPSHTPAYPFIAADKTTAAKAVGLSEAVLDMAVAVDELIVHYWGRKPVFRAVDLDEWIRSLPTERPERSTP